MLGPMSAFVGRFCCKIVAKSLNVPPQPVKPGGNKKLSKTFYLSGKFKKNSIEKSLCFCSCYFIDRGASKPASAVDAGGGALAHLPPLHGGGGAGALPLHPLLPPRHAQICCWHLPPPSSAPWHPCSEN